MTYQITLDKMRQNYPNVLGTKINTRPIKDNYFKVDTRGSGWVAKWIYKGLMVRSLTISCRLKRLTGKKVAGLTISAHCLFEERFRDAERNV